MFDKLTKDNVMLYAIKHYHNPSCEGINEFYDDMKRFKYIKRLFRKYRDSGVLKDRLLLNHIIVLDNLFGAEAASTLLFFKIEPEYWPALKAFLKFLSIMPEGDLKYIEVDSLVEQRLSEI
jgi:hypothetical protein